MGISLAKVLRGFRIDLLFSYMLQLSERTALISNGTQFVQNEPFIMHSIFFQGENFTGLEDTMD
jgi:hypothetical protein